MGEYDPAPGARLVPPTSNEYEPAPDAALVAPGVPQLSAGESFAANASNVFGAAPVISGVIRHLTEGVPYAQARDQYQQQIIDQSKEQHPTASTVGSVASLVPETVIGGAVGKVAGAVGKAAGLAAKAAPFIEAHPLITKAAQGALGGAAYGAAGGAGSAASHGQDVLPAAAEGGVGGGVIGGVLGGAAAKIGDALSNGVAKQNESIVRGAAERALPKKQGALAALIEDSDEIKPFASKATVTPGDVIQENRDILGGARSNDYDTVAKTRADIEAKVSSYEGAKKDWYGKVDQALDGGPEVGDLTEALKNKAARVTERPYRNDLLNKAKTLEEDYASISTDEAKKLLGGGAEDPATKHLRDFIDNPKNSAVSRDAAKAELGKMSPAVTNPIAALADSLPEGQKWTAKQFLDLATGGKAGSTEFSPEVRKAVEGLPFQFDPKLKIKSQDDLRKLLSISQDEAESALGTMNATKNAKLASQNQQVIGSVMNKVLDAAKKSDVEGIQDAVQNIYDTNLKQSVLLKLNEGLASKEDKLKLGKLGLGSKLSHTASSFLGGQELLGGVGKVFTGDLHGAALDAGKAALAFAAPKILPRLGNAATDAAAGGNRVLQTLQAAAARGEPKAVALMKSLQAAKKIGTAGAGAVGSVSSSTLGQQGNQ